MEQSEGLIEFIEWLVARKLSEKTVQQYARHYKLFEKDLGTKKLNQNFLDKFVINHPSNISRAFIKNLFEYHNIKDLEVPKIKGRKPVRKRKTITDQELKKMRNYLYEKDSKFGLMFEITDKCALRREEILSLRLMDFDLDLYAEDPSKSCRLLIHGKGAKERYVIVPAKVMKKLIDWIADQDYTLDEKLFDVKKSKWHDVFKEAVKRLGSHNYTLHDLRRSRATKWLDQGVDLIRVKQRLGHASVDATQRYINLDEEEELKKWEDEY